MTLNLPPYDIRVWLYPGVNPIGDWGPIAEDISAYVRYPGNDGGQPITYSGGRQNEADQVDAGQMSLTLDNRTGRFSTANFLGPYFGRLNTNTPIRLGMVTCQDSFTRTVASSGLGTSDTGNTWALGAQPWSVDGSKAQYGGAANATSFAVNQGGSALDVDALVTITANSVAAGDSYYGGITTRYTDTSNNTRTFVEFLTTGQAQLRIMRTIAGGTIIQTAVPLGAYTAGSQWRLHTLTIRDRIYASAWPVAGSEPTAWQTNFAIGSLTGRSTGLFASRNSASTGSALIAFDNYQTIGLEWAGLVSSWPIDWDMSGNNCWAAITANGIIRRLQQGKGDLKSALARQLPAYSPTGYWTLEDGPTATTFGSAITGGLPGVIFGNVTPSGGDGPPGGGPAAALADTTGAIQVQVPATASIGSADGYSAMFLCRFDAAPSVRTYVATMTCVNGPGTYVRFSVDASNSYIEIFDNSGSSIGSTTNALAADLTQWTAFQMETSISGANTAWSFIYHTVGLTTYYAMSGTYVGTAISKCIKLLMNPFGQCAAGTLFAHAWIGPNTLPFATNSFSLVSSGYAGELASDRALRVGGEAGIPIMIEAGDSVAMGVQPIADPLTTLRTCQDADQGILYERDNGLGFRPHAARFSRPVDLVLSVASGHLARPPQGISDDQRLKNKITVTRDGGGSATALDQGSINLSGEYPDPLTVVVATDSQTVDLAGWRLYLGTYPALRWPQISLQLVRLATLVQVWRGRVFGMRMQVATGRSQVLGSDPDMIIEGYQATLWPHNWSVQTNCSTATAWDVATLDDSGMRLDAASSTLNAAITTTTATSCAVYNGGDAWSTWAPTATYPAEVPFDIKINGEQMTVTNVGNPSAGVQTLTITRGINGGSKTHASGSEVHLAYPVTIVY